MTRLYDGAKAPRTEGVAFAIVNPAAGRGKAARLWPQLEPLLRAAFPRLTVRQTRGPGEAETMALEWGAEHPAGHLLVGGGDGTLHEAVNGLWASGSHAALGLLPLGSGNDFARNTGIPRDPAKAASLLETTVPRGVDLGVLSFGTESGMRRRAFLNSVSIGISVRANRLAKRLAGLGFGRARYSGAGLAAILSAKPAHYRVSIQGQPWFAGDALNVTVANGASFGAGIKISPDSSPYDGTLELVILGAMGRGRALEVFGRLQRGTHLELPEVRTTSIRSATLAGPDQLAVEADGEELDVRGGLSVEVAPARLTLLS
jgi:diacylglycerol kinase (ATP)